MNKYEHLFEPIKIGNTIVKNRIFMPPLSTNLGNKGYVTDQLVEHYKARAKGGVGLFVTEVVTIEPTYVYLPGDMSIYDDSFIEGWKKLVDGVHEYGAKILPQLFHPAYMAFPLPNTPQLIAPSNVGPYYAKSAPRPVTKEELKVIIKQFADAAYRVKLAGGDGVEVHAAHAHGLLGGFLSPLYNKRHDEYGGDINNRLRLTLEVIAAIREKCGPDFIIDVRISGDEYSDGGLNINDMTYVAKQLEKASVDMLHVSGGTTIKRGSSIPAPGTKQGSHCELAKHIKQFVKIPVATVGRINEPWIADELIADGYCDACMIGRANLCDPEFANKAYNGQEITIRPCIGCLRCLNGIMFGKPVACTMNPSFDLENEDNLQQAKIKKNILVIGGGVAGMEAAYVAKKKGHHVVLCEKQDQLGGQINLACVPIGKQDLTKVIQFMEYRLKDVDIRLNTLVTKEMIENEFKDYIVLACTGAKPNTIKDFEVFKQTMSADDILAGRAFPGQKIVIIGGGSVGCELADYLAPVLNDRYIRNRDVTIIEMDKEIMMKETGPARSVLAMRLMDKGIHIEVNAKVTNITSDTITYEKDGITHTITDANTLVFANGYHIDNSIEQMLQEAKVEYYLLGDQKHIGNIQTAIKDAYEITKNI